MQKEPSTNIELQIKPTTKILIVDDREDNLFSMETILEKDGYTIVKADSGRAALKILLSQQDFSLILMDVQMPKMNGFETASLIYERDKLKHIPIIFITAHHYGEELVFKGYKMGGVDYIYKPYNPDLLRFKVSVFVELYRKTKELVEQEKELKSTNISLQKEIDERKASERKVNNLNLQLLQNNAELKSINEELDRFAFVASHDLQEPLRKILLFSDKLTSNLAGSVNPTVNGYLSKIVKASERMHLLINDLLMYSRHTHLDEQLTKTDFNLILKDVLADLEMDIKHKQGVFVTENLPIIPAVPSLIKQLFHNLVSNALKFSKPDCPPRIEIYAEKVINDKNLKNGWYNIFVKDNGIGFDPKYAEDIFVVFKRLHSYHEIEGSGIGLSICKKIAEKHNGKIAVNSSLDEGSTFIVTLPA